MMQWAAVITQAFEMRDPPQSEAGEHIFSNIFVGKYIILGILHPPFPSNMVNLTTHGHSAVSADPPPYILPALFLGPFTPHW